MKVLVAGTAKGPILSLDQPISFWGGVDPDDGLIVDRRHPQAGVSVTGKILAMSHGRGSSSSASVLAEMIRMGTAPAGLLLSEADQILATGAHVANALYGSGFIVVVGAMPEDHEGTWILTPEGLERT